MSYLPYLADRAELTDATDLITMFGSDARTEAAARAAHRLHLFEAQRDRVLAQLTQLSMDLEMITGKIQAYRERLEQGSADRLWSVPREP